MRTGSGIRGFIFASFALLVVVVFLRDNMILPHPMRVEEIASDAPSILIASGSGGWKIFEKFDGKQMCLEVEMSKRQSFTSCAPLEAFEKHAAEFGVVGKGSHFRGEKFFVSGWTVPEASWVVVSVLDEPAMRFEVVSGLSTQLRAFGGPISGRHDAQITYEAFRSDGQRVGFLEWKLPGAPPSDEETPRPPGT